MRMRMRAYACTQAGPSLFVFKYPFPRKNTATLTMRIICFLAVAVPCAESMIHCAGTGLCASTSIVPNIACICFFPGFFQNSVEISLPNSQNKKARTYEEFKAENKEKFRVLFTSSDDESESEHEDMRLDRHFSVASSSNLAVNNQLPNSSSTPSEIAYHGRKLVDTDGYKSLSSKKGSCQHWTRLCNWWEKSKAEIIPKLLLDADIFPQNLQAYLSKPISEVLFAITHLQRAHLLSEYVRSLKPQVKDITHLGGSIKNYVDAIVRKMRNLENGKTAKQPFLPFTVIGLGTQTMSTAPFEKPLPLKSAKKTHYTVERRRRVGPQIL